MENEERFLPARFDIHGDEASHIIFSLITTSPRNTLLWNCCFMSEDFCITQRSPKEFSFNYLITKTCSHCYEPSEVLWRDLIESISNKTSPPLFPFLNTPKGTSVMQFSSTLHLLTTTTKRTLQQWAAALLHHQQNDGGGFVACSNPDLVIGLSGHLIWLFIIFISSNILAGGHVSG